MWSKFKLATVAVGLDQRFHVFFVVRRQLLIVEIAIFSKIKHAIVNVTVVVTNSWLQLDLSCPYHLN